MTVRAGMDPMNSGGIPSETRNAAQQWLLRMQSRECTAGEREAFECWRNANPLHEAAYHAVEGVWQRSAAIGTDPALGDLLRQARRLPPERSRLQRILPKLALAACLVLARGGGEMDGRRARSRLGLAQRQPAA